MYINALVLSLVCVAQGSRNTPQANESCAEWAVRMAEPTDTLLIVTNENSYYCCALRTSDGQLVFCENDRRSRATSDNLWEFSITDEDNRELVVGGAAAGEVRVRNVTATKGGVTSTVREEYGVVYRLIDSAPRYIKIVLRGKKVTDDDFKIIFNHVVDMHAGG